MKTAATGHAHTMTDAGYHKPGEASYPLKSTSEDFFGATNLYGDFSATPPVQL